MKQLQSWRGNAQSASLILICAGNSENVSGHPNSGKAEAIIPLLKRSFRTTELKLMRNRGRKLS
jgi:hypothetical protein